jgi:hypothetical protein
VLDQRGRVKVQPREYRLGRCRRQSSDWFASYFPRRPSTHGDWNQSNCCNAVFRRSGGYSVCSPSIVPHGVDHDIYLVLNDFGKAVGPLGCETDEEGTDRETAIWVCGRAAPSRASQSSLRKEDEGPQKVQINQCGAVDVSTPGQDENSSHLAGVLVVPSATRRDGNRAGSKSGSRGCGTPAAPKTASITRRTTRASKSRRSSGTSQ